MKIACIGNAVYDCTVSGDGFISEGIRNTYTNANFNAGGPAFNAASVIKRFGGDVDFYGRVGNDEFGKYIVNTLINEKINISNIQISNNIQTPFSFVIINKLNSSRTISVIRSPEDLLGAKIDIKSFRNDYDYILTDGKYAEDSINLINNNPNAISIIDAGRVNKDVINVCKNVDYIICSEDFANGVTKEKINNDYLNNKNIFLKLKSKFPKSKGIVITIGKNGYIFEKNDNVLIKEAYNSGKPSVDTNCAGDIFHGAFTYAISNGYDFFDSLEFANITASLSTTRVGGRDSCPNLYEVKEILNKKDEILIKKYVRK